METGIKAKNESPWSENDFHDLFEKPENQEDVTTVLEEGDFECSDDVSPNRSEIVSPKAEEDEPIQVVFESAGMIDYDDVY